MVGAVAVVVVVAAAVVVIFMATLVIVDVEEPVAEEVDGFGTALAAAVVLGVVGVLGEGGMDPRMTALCCLSEDANLLRVLVGGYILEDKWGGISEEV